jgi:hypothetical protein
VFDSSGSRVAISGRDRQVRVWQTLTGELIAVCRGLTANVYALGFTQDNHTIVASDGDGVIARWNVETGTLESKIQRVSPFGNQVMQDASEKYAHLWQRVASHYDWTKFRCGCGNSARHIPVDFANFVSTNPEECARAMGVEGHAEEQGMLFEASVPTAEMLLASLQDAILSESARAQVLYLLLTLAEGESHYTEVENGRPDLELECREVMRRNKSALRLQLGEKNSSLCAEYASDILRLIS